MGHIYKITNSNNNKVYIGQTRQTIEARWKQHIRDSFHPSRSYTSILHAAIRKYGEQSFVVENIETCDNKMLNEREIFWINYYDSCNNGYNISHGGNGYLKYEDEVFLALWNNGLSVSEIAEQLKSCIDTVTRHLKSCNINDVEIKNRGFEHISKANMKPIYQYDLDGNFMREYTSIEEAENINNISNIKSLSGAIHKIVGGYRWSRQCVDKLDVCEKPKTRSGRCKMVHQYTKDGEYIQSFDSITDAAKAINASCEGIRDACIGKNRTANGYRWSYEKFITLPSLQFHKSSRQVTRIDPSTGEKTYYASIGIAARDNNTTTPDIIHVCTGVRPSVKGYYWEYTTEEEKSTVKYWKH